MDFVAKASKDHVISRLDFANALPKFLVGRILRALQIWILLVTMDISNATKIPQSQMATVAFVFAVAVCNYNHVHCHLLPENYSTSDILSSIFKQH